MKRKNNQTKNKIYRTKVSKPNTGDNENQKNEDSDSDTISYESNNNNSKNNSENESTAPSNNKSSLPFVNEPVPNKVNSNNNQITSFFKPQSAIITEETNLSDCIKCKKSLI